MNVSLARVSDSQHGLASAKVQLNLLSRILQEDPSLLSTDEAEFMAELDDVTSLTQLINQKIDLLYRRVSLEFQLPTV